LFSPYERELNQGFGTTGLGVAYHTHARPRLICRKTQLRTGTSAALFDTRTDASGFARFRQYGWELDGKHFLTREGMNLGAESPISRIGGSCCHESAAFDSALPDRVEAGRGGITWYIAREMTVRSTHL
jgi:hypothetical protein